MFSAMSGSGKGGGGHTSIGKRSVSLQLKGFLVFLINFSKEDTLEKVNCPDMLENSVYQNFSY